MACGACGSPDQSLLCPSCFGDKQAGRHADLRALAEQRDAARDALAQLVAGKVESQRQQLALLRAAEERRRSRARAEELERQAAAVRQRTIAAVTDLQQRSARLAEANRELGALAHQAYAAMQAQREAAAAACLRSWDVQSREQRTKVVRRVLQILPLTLVAPSRPASASGDSSSSAAAAAAGQAAAGQAGREEGGGNGGSGPERAAATICELPLPDSRAGLAELEAMSSTLGSALGYLALLLDTLCRFLQLPVLHRCAFQGSLSRLWQPDGFFDMRPSPPINDAVLLAWPKPAAASLAPGGGAAARQAQQRQEQQLRAAIYALQRSAGALVFARLGPNAALRATPDWPPLAWLAGLCQALAAEPRAPPSIPRPPGSAAATASGAAAAGRPLAASAVFGRATSEAGGGDMAQSLMVQSILFERDGTALGGAAAEEAEEEGWEHLQRPAYGMIPPPPSQPEDVEHWVAAMYGDKSAGGSGNNSTAGGIAGAAAAALGASPLARLRALTRTYLGGLSLGSNGGGSGGGECGGGGGAG